MKKNILFLSIFLMGWNSYSQQNKNALKEVIKNQPELEAIINHYKKEGNQDKLRAASFLIANMKDKGTYVNDLVDSKGVSVGLLKTLDIDIDQKLEKASINQKYSVTSLSSILHGVTIGISWTPGIYSPNVVGTTAIIDHTGVYDYVILYKGLGTLYTQKVKYRMILDIYTGKALSVNKI